MRPYLLNPDEVGLAAVHTQQVRDGTYFATCSEVAPETRRLALVTLTETFPLVHPNASAASAIAALRKKKT